MRPDLDEQLRGRGQRYHELAERTAGDAADVSGRTARQVRNRRVAAGSAVAVIVVVAAVTLGRPSQSSMVQSGGTSPERVPTTAPAPTDPESTAATTATTVPTTSSTVPRTTAPTSTTTAPSTPVPDIHAVDFRNFTYAADSCPTGGYPDPPASGIPVRDGRFDTGTNYVDVNPVVYGDLTGDGHDEAVVPLTCSTGVGSGTITHPWAFTPDPTATTKVRRLPYPELTAAQLDQLGLHGYYPKGAVPTIASGTLNIDWYAIYDAGTPPKIVTTHQTWTGTAWRTTAPTTVADGNPNG
jgi:hypothetical protein